MITHQVTPLHIAGNTTPKQNEKLKGNLDEAVNRVYKETLKQLDEHKMALVLEFEDKFKAELTSAAHKIIERLITSEKYQEEETISRREYPSAYYVRPIEAQVTALREAFPSLGGCIERLARNPVPDEAEAWFAIPRWQAVAPTYCAAVEEMVKVIESKRRFSNRLTENLGPKFMRQHENVWSKVSCPERLSVSGPPALNGERAAYRDVVPFARAVVEEFPDRVLWGTDWPHPNLKGHMPDDGLLVDFIPDIAVTAEAQRKLLVDNPMRLYWPEQGRS